MKVDWTTNSSQETGVIYYRESMTGEKGDPRVTRRHSRTNKVEGPETRPVKRRTLLTERED